ncbi:hypothetical protein K3495_g2812 [Podosphaera aphanis]|nr:hypothetical protein K3495_g2812 [Podosphaera aphanis]
MQKPQTLPEYFPCWVRAKFSFGGESKHDLGFIEGDLIECLNAGDGSWWMGRLWRDKRVKGFFPSNFVEVLDPSFRPAVRSVSPLPTQTPGTSPFNSQLPQTIKAKPSRKPYQSYSAPTTAKRKELPKKEAVPVLSSTPSFHSKQPRTSSQIRQNVSRAHSPAPPVHEHGADAYSPSSRLSYMPSPKPIAYNNFGYRPASPLSIHNEYYSQALPPPVQPHSDNYSRPPSRCSPDQYQYRYHIHRDVSPGDQLEKEPSSPPPAPPPHRTVYTTHMDQSIYNHQNSSHQSGRASSPSPPPSSRDTGLTPSPLRDAMNNVISSLADMGVSHPDSSPEAPNEPWSPEAFDQTYSPAWRTRSNTISRLGNTIKYGENDQQYYDIVNSRVADQDPPLLCNYVQRMESRLGKLQRKGSYFDEEDHRSAAVSKAYYLERQNSFSTETEEEHPKLRYRRSAYEIGKSMLGRTFTTKTNSTNSSSATRSTATNATASTDRTSHTLMSGPSASGLSHTSAASLERKRLAANGRMLGNLRTKSSVSSHSDIGGSRSGTSLTEFSYHSSHASEPFEIHKQAEAQKSSIQTGNNALGGLMAPKPRKSGFFKKIIETAKTGAANARSSIAAADSFKTTGGTKIPNGVTSFSGGHGNNGGNAGKENKLAGGNNVGIDWVQVRRDVNRSNSLSRIERMERRERCQMMDYLTIRPVDEFYQRCYGDEGLDGHPVSESANFDAVNFTQVDKNTRFINNLPPMTNPISLATGFVCRPYKSDVQRLRAIFIWISEKIAWEEDFEGHVDSRRVIQSKKGCAQEVAILVKEMCAAVGIHAEIVNGYLKTPGEIPDWSTFPRANHWWNCILVDGEWRIMDCALAAPTHPRRSLYSSAHSHVAESWWFLARPTKICWTHIPDQPRQQHICPPAPHEILLALPCACPPFFKNDIEMVDYDTSLVRIEDLELAHIKFTVPADIECVAEVEAKAFDRDGDGDLIESCEVVKKRALAQAEWIGGQKQYTVKALLPNDEGHGVLKIYAGKRGLMHSIKDIPHPLAFALPIIHTGDNPPYEGLMHSIKDIPHPLAFALPIIHTGDNPPYEFLTRHPTPHAQRYDLYVAQPQCHRLALNNTFIFAVRQHPSTLCAAPVNPGGSSPIQLLRPTSAMSMNSSSILSSNASSTDIFASVKPAKLAIQSPSGKVLRLMRKEERNPSTSQPASEKGNGGTWETIIKVGERGVWRGLVLADRTARWCVFAEWTCI